MIIAIISFFSVICGASLQYLFTRYLENQRHYRSLRTQAYTDYLKCVCEQAQLAPKPQSQVKKEIFARTADAKARICLYGSTTAIQTFALFENLGATMNSDQQRNAFTSMVLTMRNDSCSQSGAKIEDLKIILLGNHDTIT